MVARFAPTLVARAWDAVACRLVVEGRPLRVHSIFERALNLQTIAGELLGLVGPRAGNGPSTIVLDRLAPVGLNRAGIAPGAPATGTDSELRIATQLTVDLRLARLWLPPSTRLAVSLQVALTRVERAEAAARAAAPAGGLAPLLPHLATLAATAPLPELMLHQDEGGEHACCRGEVSSPWLGRGDFAPTPGSNAQDYRDRALVDPLGRAAWSALSSLLPAWRGDDGEAVETSAARLVGLGPGLTPSGDDLLAGLLVATDRVRGGIPTAVRRACIRAVERRTTDVAVARVRHAARGAIEEVQERVLASLLGANDAGLVPAVERAARWGHTSGVDTLVGLFLGLRLTLAAPPDGSDGRPPGAAR